MKIISTAQRVDSLVNGAFKTNNPIQRVLFFFLYLYFYRVHKENIGYTFREFFVRFIYFFFFPLALCVEQS